MSNLKCHRCGYIFEPIPHSPACPRCNTAVPEIVHSTHIGVSASVSILKIDVDGKELEFFESPRDRLSIDVAVQGNSIRTRLTGPPPQGEADTLHACGFLIDALNAKGATWGIAVKGDGIVDAISKDSTNPARTLRMQHVRVRADQAVWKTLGNTGTIETRDDVSAMAGHIAQAIVHKTSKYSLASQRGVVLVVDATRLPGYAFPEVVSTLKANHSDLIDSVAFESIWLVGPIGQLVSRIC